MLTWLRIIGPTAACAMALAAPTAPALAQTSSESGYDETGVLSTIVGVANPTTTPNPTPAPEPTTIRTIDGRWEQRVLGTSRESPTLDGSSTNIRGGHSLPSTHVPRRARVADNLAEASSGGSPGGRSTLPFTGRDLIVVALLGLLLVGIGSVMRIGTPAGLNVPVVSTSSERRNTCRR